jgi:hypothetical protein
MRSLFLIVPLLALAACGGSKTKPVVVNAPSCNIEAPVNKAEVAAKADINVLGWFFDKFTEKSTAGVRVQLASADRKVIQSFDAGALTPRSDVASALKEPLAEKSGFSVKVPANTLAPSTYDISLIRETDEAIVVCFSGHSVTVK